MRLFVVVLTCGSLVSPLTPGAWTTQTIPEAERHAVGGVRIPASGGPASASSPPSQHVSGGGVSGPSSVLVPKYPAAQVVQQGFGDAIGEWYVTLAEEMTPKPTIVDLSID